MPRLLIIEQKQRRDDVSLKCLALLHRNKAEVLRLFITMDEIWAHNLTPETKEQSKQWIGCSASCPKKPKIVPSAGKVIASVLG